MIHKTDRIYEHIIKIIGIMLERLTLIGLTMIVMVSNVAMEVFSLSTTILVTVTMAVG